MTTRELVLEMLLREEEGMAFSHDIIKDAMVKNQYLVKQDRAFITRLFEGVVERELELDYIINQFSRTRTQKMKPVIRNLLRMGVYQIFYMDGVKDFAAVNECVALAGKKGFSSLRGFVNGVLRNISRKRAEISYPDPEREKNAWLSVHYSYPEWLVGLWVSEYGEELAEKMMASSLTETGFSVRCNLVKVTPEKLAEEFLEEGVTAVPSPLLPYAFTICGLDYLDRLPSFMNGHFIVQDQSSMLVAHCAGLEPGDRVLDLCAAPGGKSTHAAQILWMLHRNGPLHSADSSRMADDSKCGTDESRKEGIPAGYVLARDVSAYKTEKILENKERLGLSNLLVECQDALSVREDSLDTFDVVFADLPCSGLGVIGKKNDIKYRTEEKDCSKLALLQREMLSVAAGYVKPGGILMYSTCTIHPLENEENADWFLQHHPFAAVPLQEVLPEELKEEETVPGRLCLLPGVHGTDGFFIAKFRKECQQADTGTEVRV